MQAAHRPSRRPGAEPRASRARRAGARDRRLAFRSGDRLPVLARLREEARLGSARARSQAFADLARFGQFEDEWLRGGPVQRWMPKGSPASRSSCSRPAARPACRRRASRSTTSASTTSCSATTLPDEYFPKGVELADARAVRARAGCAWRSSTSRSTAAASASASISIRAGSSS